MDAVGLGELGDLGRPRRGCPRGWWARSVAVVVSAVMLTGSSRAFASVAGSCRNDGRPPMAIRWCVVELICELRSPRRCGRLEVYPRVRRCSAGGPEVLVNVLTRSGAPAIGSVKAMWPRSRARSRGLLCPICARFPGPRARTGPACTGPGYGRPCRRRGADGRVTGPEVTGEGHQRGWMPPGGARRRSAGRPGRSLARAARAGRRRRCRGPARRCGRRG